MKKVLFITRRGRKFRVDFFNKLYETTKKDFNIKFLFTHPLDFDRKDTVFEYAISKESYPFGIKKEALSIDTKLPTYIKKEIDIVVLPAPDHPLSTLEFMKLYKKAKELGKKTVLWWNPPSWKERFFKKIWWAIRKRLIRGILRDLDSMVTYCTQGKKTLVKEYGIAPKKVFIATNSLNNEEILKKSKYFLKDIKRLRRDYGLDGKKIILFLGKIDAGKNLESLIIAMKKVIMVEEKAVLVLIGEGAYRNKLESIVENMNLGKNVFFLGENKKDPEKIINLAELAVLPGLGGLALNHIMLCGKPVISSRADGTPLDLIDNGENGFLLDIDTSDEISEKILLLLKEDLLRINMGKKAAKSIKQKANTEKMVNSFIQALKSV